jgi:hypothetical protein
MQHPWASSERNPGRCSVSVVIGLHFFDPACRCGSLGRSARPNFQGFFLPSQLASTLLLRLMQTPNARVYATKLEFSAPRGPAYNQLGIIYPTRAFDTHLLERQTIQGKGGRSMGVVDLR